jgi:hypothetical protein
VIWLYPSMSRHSGLILKSIQKEGTNNAANCTHFRTVVREFRGSFTNCASRLFNRSVRYVAFFKSWETSC